MANTEKIVILKQVREIESTITGTLAKPDLTQRQRDALGDLSLVLRDIDNLILLNELNECIDDLKSRSQELKKINGRIKRQAEKLGDISAQVGQVAKAIDAVAKAFRLLTEAGVV